MEKTFTIASVFFLLNFVTLAQIPSDASLKICAINLSKTNYSGVISNTQPDVEYEIQSKPNRTNWVSLGFVLGSETMNWTAFDFRITNVINSQTIRVRSWIDSQGAGIPDWWQLRYFGSVGIDPYGNPEGDGWNNMQKFQNGMDPFQWYMPPGPTAIDMGYYDNGSVVIKWSYQASASPDFFIIERAEQSLQANTNLVRSNFAYRENSSRTNFSTPPRPPRRPGLPPGHVEPPFITITGPFREVARVQPTNGVREYRWSETYTNAVRSPMKLQPAYRVSAHFTPPLHAVLKGVDAPGIRQTISSVKAQQTTNGYDLMVLRPIPYARYLLLVRDQNDRQWHASGYFYSGTNRNLVCLHVDKKGMMSDGQNPITMPEVKFLPDVVGPEFKAGWGEDSDGDVLPDVYEVLVTHTEPDNDDTGNTGVLDGFKKMTSDGLSNFEKFRCRVDPLHPAHPPQTVELKQPTGFQIEKAVIPQSDLHCELQIEVRTNGAANYQPVERVPWMVGKIFNFQQPSEPRRFDLRVSWQFSEIEPHKPGSFDVPPQYQAIQSVVTKANIQLFEIFSNNLAYHPPASRNDITNIAAAINRAYRDGEMDKGLIMAEMMLLEDSQPQFFYGKVIDQHGQPVIGAEITLRLNSDFGRGGTYKTNADTSGNFQFTGLRGKSLSITAEKKGYQNAGQGLGLKGPAGPDTSANNRAPFIMWKLKGPEPMVHKEISSRKIQPDGRVFTIDFLKNEITEGTNVAGDMFVQIQRPPQVKPREQFDWSFVMTAIQGGFIEVTNDAYLNEAPESGYQPQYQMNRYATNVYNYSTHELYRTDRTFFLKSRGGQVYGHFQIKDLDPAFRGGMAVLRIESYINPSGSRNLEFDSAKQVR